MNLLSVLLKSLLADGAISALAKKTGIGTPPRRAACSPCSVR